MNDMNKIRQVPLAVVGMACRLPGANNLVEFWDMLVNGRSAIDDLPPEQFDQELYYDPVKGTRNKSYTRRGAIPESRHFDRARCPIAEELVAQADPTHLVMCQTAADALRHGDMDPMALSLRHTGVYLGHTIGSGLEGDHNCSWAIDETAAMLREVEGFRDLPPATQEAVCTGFVEQVRRRYRDRVGNNRDLSSNMAAGIISKGFGLTGPFMSVNAACASSLEALLLAGRALQRGKIDMAIVGGASVCTRDWLVLFSGAQSVSPSDSRPFDHQADGLIIAEAYVAIVVKTLERAMADGDPVHAVIRSFGISSDGRGKSLWAPRREGQVEAIRRAYGPGVDAADLQYLEAHATATQLGDATEVAALTEALSGVFPTGKKIPITSAKANIGHALEAAGLVGIVKAVLCMQKGIIPSATKIERLNPAIDWDEAPVYVPLQSIAWPEADDGKPRRTGVNAFGVGGLNVHVVVDEFQPSATRFCQKAKSEGGWAIAQRWPRIEETGPLPDASAGLPRCTVGSPHDPIAIIGAGCVLPGGRDLAEYWDILCSGCDPWQTAADGTGPVAGCVQGFEYNWRRHKIPPKQIERADPLQFMVLEAADEAVANAGYDKKPFDNRRTGVVVGTEFVGDFNYQLQLVLRLPRLCRMLTDVLTELGQPRDSAEAIVDAWNEAVHARWPVLSDETGSFSASSLAGRIIKTWDLMGGGMALDSGTTSAAAALDGAVDMLTSGDCDMMFCVGAQRNLNPVAREILTAAGRLASGYVQAEGAGVLLLKRLSDARRDGDPVRAIIHDVEAVHDEGLAYRVTKEGV